MRIIQLPFPFSSLPGYKNVNSHNCTTIGDRRKGSMNWNVNLKLSREIAQLIECGILVDFEE